MKKLYKRVLFIGLSLSLLALVGLNALEESEVEGHMDGDEDGPAPAPPKDIGDFRQTVLPRAQPRPLSATTVTFSGTLLRNGASYVLRETAGVLYTLDETGRASRFEGDSVRVTGKLDTSTRLLQVEDIRSFVA